MIRIFVVLTFIYLAIHAQTSAQQDKSVHMNQIQVIGSHNSYNMGFAPSEAAFLKARNPEAYASLEYAHKSIANQLDGGVRQLEIDVFPDPAGGRFSHPRIIELSKQAGLPADPDFDPKHDMDKPGMKVIHVQDVNQRSSCPLFVECLQQVRDWSKAHPQHLPVFLLIENKSGNSGMPGGVNVAPWTAAEFDALDKEIRSVFKTDEMILPHQVRGKYKTLNAAVLAGNWPTLAMSRGKVIFLLDQKKSGPVYAAGHPNLEGRVLFTNAVPGQPDAAFIEENNGSQAEIEALVKQGYLVRTRTDEGTAQARTNDRSRIELGLLSGAQMLSTDYPSSEPSRWTSYVVELPGKLIARCNPVNAPANCKSELLEPR